MGIENFHRQTALGERLEKERFDRAYPVVNAGFRVGHFKHLTPRQQEVLITLYSLHNLPEENSTETDPTLISYGQCVESLGTTRQAIEQRHNSAVRRLERVRNNLPPVRNMGRPAYEMDSDTRKLLLQNQDLSMGGLHELFSRSEQVIRRWLDEAEMPRRKIGRPRKEKPDVPRRPVGRPRKSGVSS